MATQPTSASRAEEMNRLIVKQGQATRSMKYGWVPDEETKARIEKDATRLDELAELLSMGDSDSTPEAYVNDRIAAWVRMNPLPLSMERVRSLLTEHLLYSLEGGVLVSIGDLKASGYQYRVMADDFAWSGARVEGEGDNEVVRGDMVLRVPDSVAEHFRQQGRRALQREHAALMGVASKV
jgi:hypothetical protein